MTNKLTLFIPNLLTRGQGQSLPMLARLLGRAKSHGNGYITIYEVLAELFGYQGPLPIAAITALADGLAVNAGEWWLRLDPVELSADQATVYLLGNRQLNISVDEAAQLAQAINEFLQLDGLELLAPHPLRWYIKLRNESQLKTIPPETMQDKAITSYLSEGAAYWRRLFSEIQIVLYSHAVNRYRQQANRPTINGVWLWGEGRLSATKSQPRWQKVYCDGELGQGLAQWAKIPVSNVPSSFCDEHTNSLVILSEHHVLSDMEALWFGPIVKALKSRIIEQITIITEQQSFVVTGKDIKKWWRRDYPLS